MAEREERQIPQWISRYDLERAIDQLQDQMTSDIELVANDLKHIDQKYGKVEKKQDEYNQIHNNLQRELTTMAVQESSRKVTLWITIILTVLGWIVVAGVTIYMNVRK